MIDLPHDGPTVFVDRNTGGKVFRQFIVDNGIRVVLHDEHFGPSARGVSSPPDHHWLVEIGRLGWLIVTADKRTLREPLFLAEIERSNAFVFVLADMNGGGPQDRARCMIDAYPKMLSLAAAATRPSIWIFKGGQSSQFDWRERVAKYKSYRRISG